MRSIAYSPDGKRLAIGTSLGDGSYLPGEADRIKVVEADTGKESLPLEQPPKTGLCVAYSPDGKRLASGGNGDIKIWDSSTGRLIVPPLAAHGNEQVRSLSFDADGGRLASGGDDATARIWNGATGREIRTYRGHVRGFVSAVAFSPDGGAVASVSLPYGCVRLWDALTGADLVTVGEPAGRVDGLALSPDGRTVACCGDVRIQLWDVSGPAPVKGPTLRGHENIVASVAFSPDGKVLASCDLAGTIRLWDPSWGKALFTRARNDSAADIAFSPDGLLLVTCSRKKHLVELWDARSVVLLHAFEGHTSPVNRVVFSPDGRVVASASDNGTLKLWDPIEFREVRTLHGPANTANDLAFTPDSQRLLYAGNDKTLRFWDLVTGKESASRESCKLT